MDNEPARVRELFDLLVAAPIVSIEAGTEPQCPTAKGVYIIYDPNNVVLHVGRSQSGVNGIRQRIMNHIRGQSSFVRKAFPNQVFPPTEGFGFRYLVVPDPRERALLEYHAIGSLCPKHLGVSNVGMVPF
jgi:excinuclease UvrABC nuclease subunit